MKKNIRSSNTKKGKMTGFRYRNRTSNGKKIIKRRRSLHKTI